MEPDAQAHFDAEAAAWARYNRSPLGRIRQELTWHNLAPCLPAVGDTGDPPRVLDAGGGSGELALRLVQRGYRVWLLDYAPAMLDQARRAARTLSDQAQARLTLCQMTADEVTRSFAPGSFDVITCHTLVEYLPEPHDTLRELASLLRDGGLLSLSFVNRHAEVLRQVWKQDDPAGALDKVESGCFCARLFGISARAYTAEEVTAWLVEFGLTVVASRGVRAFADYVPDERLDDPAFFAELLRLEQAAAGRSPYRLIARYVHLLAREDVELS